LKERNMNSQNIHQCSPQFDAGTWIARKYRLLPATAALIAELSGLDKGGALTAPRTECARQSGTSDRIDGAFAVALRIKRGAALPRFRIDGQIGPLVAGPVSEGIS
jgi:hypothetical protein